MFTDIIKVKIERPVYGGVFIARHGGKIALIRGAVLPGETVEAAIESVKKDYLSASVLRVLEASPERARPLCKYFGECGGCHLQHMSYERQVQLKEEVLVDCLKRMAKTEVTLSVPITGISPWNYRLRGQFKISPSRSGFYRENTREIVDIEDCPIMDKKINESFRTSKPLLKQSFIKEMHITAGDSLIGLIRTSADKEPVPYWKRLSAALMDSHFSGISVERAQKNLLTYGSRFITLTLSGLQYTLSPMSFFQSNWTLNTTVLKHMKNTLGPLKGKRVLDLYAGAGNFSLPFADDAEVVAVEENRFAVEDGRRNIAINGITTCAYVHASAENVRPEGHFDVVILDPPRRGLSKGAMNIILSLLPDRIVYVSCNPATFARDLKELLIRYAIESIHVADFFPQTFHIESLAFLKLR